jgi:hypothetical protein
MEKGQKDTQPILNPFAERAQDKQASMAQVKQASMIHLRQL